MHHHVSRLARCCTTLVRLYSNLGLVGLIVLLLELIVII